MTLEELDEKFYVCALDELPFSSNNLHRGRGLITSRGVTEPLYVYNHKRHMSASLTVSEHNRWS